jgi:hypothetical protein
VRNNLDVGISNNGDLQQVGMDETYAELDVAFTAKYDGTPEGGESITLRLISSSDFIVESPNDIAVPLADDDLLVWMEAARDAVRSPLQEGLIRLSLSSAAPKAITAFYSVAGTAVAGTDYTTLSGSVLIPQGATAVDIPVSTLSGSTGEGTVQATIVAGSADYVISGSGPTQGASATINVLQGSTTATPDAVVSIATTTASAADAPAGTLSFTLTAVRSGTTNPTIEVPVLVGGSAVPGTDYTAVPATLSLPGLVIGSEVAPSATFINLRTTSGTYALAVGDTLRLGSLGSTYTVRTAASLSTTAVPVELTAAVGAGLPASSSAGVTRRVYRVPVAADATAEGNETITVAMVDTSTGNNFNLNSSAQSITLTITDTASGGGSAAAKPSAGTGGGCSAGGASALLLAGGLFVVGLRRRRR